MNKKDIFPQHISDFLNLFHTVVFEGNDGEESWPQFLTIDQKECISLALAIYYCCEHCTKFHVKVLSKIKKVKQEQLLKTVSSMILFLRTDISRVSNFEFTRWLEAWDQFSYKITLKYKDPIIAELVGLSIGLARDDSLFISFFGKKVKEHFTQKQIDYREVIGDIFSLTVFMKAAVTRNRVSGRIDALIET